VHHLLLLPGGLSGKGDATGLDRTSAKITIIKKMPNVREIGERIRHEFKYKKIYQLIIVGGSVCMFPDRFCGHTTTGRPRHCLRADARLTEEKKMTYYALETRGTKCLPAFCMHFL
jgi:hypothetical protein